MLKAYLTDSITILTATLDEWGSRTDAETNVKGRFEYKTRQVRNIQGELVVSSAKVLLSTTTIDHKDRIKYGGVIYSILTIARKKDFSNQYLELYLS